MRKPGISKEAEIKQQELSERALLDATGESDSRPQPTFSPGLSAPTVRQTEQAAKSFAL